MHDAKPACVRHLFTPRDRSGAALQALQFYMKAPIQKLSKDKIIWLFSHRCKHGHSFIEHYNCWLKEESKGVHIGFFDIETSSLVANYGMMLCYAIKDDRTGKVIFKERGKEDIDEVSDKRLVRDCVEDMKKFDKLITWYGARFDIPFVRTRAIMNGIDFPKYGELYHQDAYDLAKHKLKLNSNRLESACQAVLGRTNKTHLYSGLTDKCVAGKKKAMKFLEVHNRYDVIDLGDIYHRLCDFAKTRSTSV